MELVRWNSMPRFGFNRHFNRLFDDFFAPTERIFYKGLTHWHPAVDVLDAEEKLVIKAELPGLSKENISVDVKGNVLTLKGERTADNEVNEENYRCKERSHGSFERRFALADGVNPEKISAGYVNGVLKIEIPKPEAVKPRQIAIH